MRVFALRARARRAGSRTPPATAAPRRGTLRVRGDPVGVDVLGDEVHAALRALEIVDRDLGAHLREARWPSPSVLLGTRKHGQTGVERGPAELEHAAGSSTLAGQDQARRSGSCSTAAIATAQHHVACDPPGVISTRARRSVVRRRFGTVRASSENLLDAAGRDLAFVQHLGVRGGARRRSVRQAMSSGFSGITPSTLNSGAQQNIPRSATPGHGARAATDLEAAARG